MGLGSIPFLILVVVRIAMAGNFLQLFHIVAAVLLLGLLSIRIRDLHSHSARIIILAIFTSVFYDDIYYTVFALLTALVAQYGLVKYLQQKTVPVSVGAGLVCSAASYLIALPLGLPNI